MKKYFVFLTCIGLMLSSVFVFTACETSEDEEKKGSIAFWTSDEVGGEVKIELKGNGTNRSGSLSQKITSGTANCSGSSGVFSDLSYGEYTYTASTKYHNWSGKLTLDNNCLTQELGITTGNIMFWMNADYGEVEIELKGNGITRSGTLSEYFTSGSPDTCGEEGTLTFLDLPFGTYSYKAKSDSYEWSNNNLVVQKACQAYRLNIKN